MKRIIGYILIALAMVLTIYSFNTNLRTEYCCQCNLDEWKAGSGFVSPHRPDSCGDICNPFAGCIPSYKILPLDFLGIAVVGAICGILLVRKKKKENA